MKRGYLNWNQVFTQHKTVAGIYSVKRKLVSLLVNTSKESAYPNVVTADKITYCLGTQTQSWGINAMLKALEDGAKVRVFHKINVNQWHDLGFWKPAKIGGEKDTFWPVTLIKC